jgi:hypothetical protein
VESTLHKTQQEMTMWELSRRSSQAGRGGGPSRGSEFWVNT